MTKRKIRIILAVIILVVSLVMLGWGLWPFAHITRILPFPPGELQLPVPAGFWLGLCGV